MKLFLLKPDIKYYEQYNKMMKEWIERKTNIAPWFLEKEYETEVEFSEFVNMLNNIEVETTNSSFPTQSLYFVLDDNYEMIGACRLAHYLCLECTTDKKEEINVWGHIGYGVKPSKRGKGYATEIVKQLLIEAKKRNIDKVYLGVHDDNIASIKVIEKNRGILIDTVNILEDSKKIRRYYIDNT